MMPPAVRAVVQPSVDEVELTLAVSHSHPAFAGHFPERPILPGVVQIDWAMRLANDYLGIDQPVATDFQVKFHRLFEPGPDLVLMLRRDRARAALIFEYRTGDAPVSSGRIKMGAP